MASVKKDAGNWVKKQAATALDMEFNAYGLNVAFIRRLEQYDCAVGAPMLSRIFNNGINSSVFSNASLLKSWCLALDCTMYELLIEHGYDLEHSDKFGDAVSQSVVAMKIVRVLDKALETGQEDKLETGLTVIKSLLD